MNLPYLWLNDYVTIEKDPKTYAARMTMTGSKVEGWQNAADEIQNVVWGKILSIEKHPDADKLVICQVDVGDKTTQIVTGATNLSVGDIVPACLHGARLPGGVVIKKAKMRGVESNGMLCSFAELGLTLHDLPYADPNGITPNRPDCLSVIGLARETAASFELPLKLPQPPQRLAEGEIHNLLKVEIADPDLCPRYCAAMARNIKIAPSPKWMRDRLRAAGVRPINNIVDITNFVMLEYGQPMHAFDYRCIDDNAIVVRRAKAGETTATLDGQQRQLPEGALLITDPQKPIGVAGVMGGLNSEITENTQMIVFESATFDGPSIRATSRRLGLRTEASGRYEKGLDCENAMPALMRACQLVEQLGAGEVVTGVIDAYPVKKTPRSLPLEPEKIRRFLGADIAEEEMIRTLKSLQFGIEGQPGHFIVSIPSWRDDVEGMADLAEEAARIYGYDKIEPTLFGGSVTQGGLNPYQRFELALSEACMAAGYNEAMSLSFQGVKDFDKILLPEDAPQRKAVQISNPLGEDQSLMRTTSLPAMLEICARNYNRRLPAGRFFELSKIYLPQQKDGQPDLTVLADERPILTMALYGNGDFFTLKGGLEAIFASLSIPSVEFLPCSENPSYHPGRSAVLMAGEKKIGFVGQIHPAVLRNYGIGAEQSLPVLYLEKTIRAAAGKTLERLELFDVYQGAQVGEGKKSVAFSLAFRSYDHTLTDQEADAALQKALIRLKEERGAEIRS